jgi:hypothetical protein
MRFVYGEPIGGESRPDGIEKYHVTEANGEREAIVELRNGELWEIDSIEEKWPTYNTPATGHSRLTSVVGQSVSFVLVGGSLVAVFSLANSLRGQMNDTIREVYRIEVQRTIDSRFGSERRDIDDIKKQLADMRQQPGNTQIQAVTSALDSLDTRLSRMEGVIQTDSSKALVIPLLRKDIDHMRSLSEAEQAGVQRDLARLYQFALGFLASLALLILGYGLNAFFRSRKD